MRLSSLQDDVKIFGSTKTTGFEGIKYQLWQIIWEQGWLEITSPLNNTVLMSHDLLGKIFEWGKQKSWVEYEAATVRMSQNLAIFLNQVTSFKWKWKQNLPETLRNKQNNTK